MRRKRLHSANTAYAISAVTLEPDLLREGVLARDHLRGNPIPSRVDFVPAPLDAAPIAAPARLIAV
jgi:hypothetical protein